METAYELGEPLPIGVFAAAGKLEQLLGVLVKYTADLGLAPHDLAYLREAPELLARIRNTGVAPATGRPRRWIFGPPPQLSASTRITIPLSAERVEQATRAIEALSDSIFEGAPAPEREAVEVAREVVSDLFAAVVEQLGDSTQIAC